MLKAHAAASRHSADSSPRLSLLELTSTVRDPSTGQSSFAHRSPQLHSLRSSPYLIVDVWQSNLREVFDKIMWIVDEYPYIAMDTEFPGIVARPSTAPPAGAKNLSAYHYQTIKLNVDMLKLIQLGLCFCNEKGEISTGAPGVEPAAAPAPTSVTPTAAASHASALSQGGGIVYQFHFQFSLSDDMYAQDSIDVLTAAGIDFGRHAREGIDPLEFAELLMTSGVILNEDIRWLTFHSGFDFAYLLHLLIGGGQGQGGDSSTGLPASESDFFELISLYFPCIYDIKALLKHIPASAGPETAELHHGGLQGLAQALGVARIGSQHQAGSDSLLTAAVFFALRNRYFKDIIPPTVAQIQQAEADKQEEKEDGKARSGGDSKEKEREKEESLQKKADESLETPLALLTNFHVSEEKYLNYMYGLNPLANQLLRANREKERAQNGVGSGHNNQEKEGEEAQRPRGSSTTAAPRRTFKPATSAPTPPDF